MDKLLMLGTSSLSVEIVNLAKARGIYTITTDYLEPNASTAKLISDEYWMISTGDIDALEKKCREEGITAILTGVSEFNIEIMMELCSRLDLPCYCTPKSWNTVQRKHNFKRLCRECGVPVPTDYYLSDPPTEKELAGITFPVVVKPVDGGGNKGISFCYNKEELIAGCACARSISSDKTVIVEQMLQGREYTVHYAMVDGEVSLLSMVATFSQPGAPTKCYSLMTSAADKLQCYVNNVEPQVKLMLKAAGCSEGICWVQLFLDKDDQFYAIEMGYRLSGSMINLSFRDVYGFDSLAWLLDIAVGKKHTVMDLPVSLKRNSAQCACAYIIWSNSDGAVDHFTGIGKITQLPNVYVRKIAKEGNYFRQHQYLLVIVFVADDYSHMKKMIEQINDAVKVIDQNGNNAAIYFDDFDTVRAITEAGL